MAFPRVLIVDDSELAREVIEETLRDAGFDAIGVQEVEGLIEVVASRAPALVLVDLTMEPLSGEEVVQRLFEAYPDPEFPVLLFSGHSLSHLQEATERCGADGFIQKAGDDAQFVDDIKGWLSLSQGSLQPGP